jgi:hypothetical protein
MRVPCSSRRALLLLAILGLGCAAGDPVASGAPEPDLSVVAGDILALWQDTDLVCLGETHGSVLDEAMREALVAHPRFADTVEVIVVEFASPLHQAMLDRLVIEGEPLSRDQLRPIWRDAGLGEVWELPLYEAFFRAVARRNAGLPRGERVPVVGAALPVDWQRVRAPEDLAHWGDRTEHFEAVLRREILDAGRKGLALFGTAHCGRRPPFVLARLAAVEPGRSRAVFGFEVPGGAAAGRAAFGLGPEPRLLPVAGTVAAAWPTGAMFYEGHAYAGVRLGELVDAIVYYGDHDDTLLDPADLSFAPGLRTELDRRARLWFASRSGE